MSEFDISNMGTEVIDNGAEYEAPSEFYRPPEPNVGKSSYTTIQAVEGPADGKFYNLSDFDTHLPIAGFSVNIQFEIKGGAQDGQKFYTMIDTRKSQYRNGSMVKDYLLGSGFQGRLQTVDDFKNAVQTFIGPVDAKLTWTGDKCETCEKRTLKKLSDFPRKADGTYNHVGICPDCGEKVGARVKISMFRVPDQG